MKILSSIGAFARPARLARMSTLAMMVFVVAVAAPAPAEAQLRVDITRGTVEPMPIAIPEFFGTSPQEIETGLNMSNLISADLERSGLFKPSTVAPLSRKPRHCAGFSRALATGARSMRRRW